MQKIVSLIVNLDEDAMDFRRIPVELSVVDKVTRVSCGTDFSACITVKGQLFTWGLNKWGNLGVENNTFDSKQNIVNTPTLVKTLINKFVIQVKLSFNLGCLWINSYALFNIREECLQLGSW